MLPVRLLKESKTPPYAGLEAVVSLELSPQTSLAGKPVTNNNLPIAGRTSGRGQKNRCRRFPLCRHGRDQSPLNFYGYRALQYLDTHNHPVRRLFARKNSFQARQGTMTDSYLLANL